MVDHLPGVCKAVGSIPNAPRQTSEARGNGSVGNVLATPTRGPEFTSLSGFLACACHSSEVETGATLVLTGKLVQPNW